MKHLQIKTAKKTSKVPLYESQLGSQAETIPAYFTHTVSEGDPYAGLLSNPKLYSGRTYYVKILFRTRGNGNSTESKCSSIGFITFWDNWNSSRSYIHVPKTAYQERGHFVSWTYSFTVDSDIQPTGTSLYFIINNYWANGGDNQTIDLYYAKYWDSTGQVYNEIGTDYNILEVEDKKANNLYFTPLLETNRDSIISLKGKYYPTTLDFFEGLSYLLPDASGMVPGNFSTSAGEMRIWQSNGFYKLTFTIKDNYVASTISCHYYKDHTEWLLWDGQPYPHTVVDFNYTRSYNDNADSNIYLYKNGKILNSANYDLDRGGTFTVYVKPNDIIAIKHIYRGDGVIVTKTTSNIKEETVEEYINNGDTSWGYIKESGNSTYSTSGGFGRGKANPSSITFTASKPESLEEISEIVSNL